MYDRFLIILLLCFLAEPARTHVRQDAAKDSIDPETAMAVANFAVSVSGLFENGNADQEFLLKSLEDIRLRLDVINKKLDLLSDLVIGLPEEINRQMLISGLNDVLEEYPEFIIKRQGHSKKQFTRKYKDDVIQYQRKINSLANELKKYNNPVAVNYMAIACYLEYELRTMIISDNDMFERDLKIEMDKYRIYFENTLYKAGNNYEKRIEDLRGDLRSYLNDSYTRRYIIGSNYSNLYIDIGYASRSGVDNQLHQRLITELMPVGLITDVEQIEFADMVVKGYGSNARGVKYDKIAPQLLEEERAKNAQVRTVCENKRSILLNHLTAYQAGFNALKFCTDIL